MQRVLLVEDHAAFRQALALLFDAEPGFEVAGQAGTLKEARRAALRARPRLTLGVIDLNLPDGDGSELIGELRRRNPEFAALVLTASLDRAEHARAVEAGAAGVLHKSAEVDEILDAARRLAVGEQLMSPQEVSEMIRLAGRSREEERLLRENAARLTPREREVLQALAEGLSNREIAERLHMSVDTERTHMVNILNKLGAHSRLQALVLAARAGVVRLGGG
ncbi:DNA-binding response regulator [Rubrobacter xylanophilus]|uniref:DNA-binding response regulator n=1 Tax=Rubrobacter xylanophilus TaxID=49319 RepID=A0A510HK43_9ACTN|nr:response regulator transcription factor [Rubrobacter xylanophilus]BBL80389.1 DNA-binding response regulator [Rubrobacter xylanophilus]